VSVSGPPPGASKGRCEMQLVVHVPGQGDVAVKIRDVAPVAKWPDAGATLPILVAVGDPRRVRVLWDRIRTHGEVAEEREEAQEYPAQPYPDEMVTDDGYLDDILDEEAYDEPPLVDLGTDAAPRRARRPGPAHPLTPPPRRPRSRRLSRVASPRCRTSRSRTSTTRGSRRRRRSQASGRHRYRRCGYSS